MISQSDNLILNKVILGSVQLTLCTIFTELRALQTDGMAIISASGDTKHELGQNWRIFLWILHPKTISKWWYKMYTYKKPFHWAFQHGLTIEEFFATIPKLSFSLFFYILPSNVWKYLLEIFYYFFLQTEVNLNVNTRNIFNSLSE